MGQAFNRPFEVALAAADAIPPARRGALPLGGHLEGCRIGFDLGASDYKVAAVQDGEIVFSTEIPWNPKAEADPAYHYACIDSGFKLAASHLPRLDAIGGSSAGILVDNQVMVASLFRAVPKDRFDAAVRPIFLKLREAWKVPLEVINDGDVTALAGGLSLEKNGILGIALGSSEAVGFLDRSGSITGWLNELAFSTVDANPAAGTDDWSGNPGVGAAYFSQQAVDKLAGPAGFTFPADMALPERLKAVQARMAQGDPAARTLFETIGAYLGYTLPWYAEFYDLEHAMILGRVTSGEGGEIILAKAREVLEAEFPALARTISIFLPDEKSRRVGQAVAAASLPPLGA
jgi:predicted NBD/HSP70 family sugar kinase